MGLKPIPSRELAHNKLLKAKLNEVIRYVSGLSDKLENIEFQLSGIQKELGLK